MSASWFLILFKTTLFWLNLDILVNILIWDLSSFVTPINQLTLFKMTCLGREVTNDLEKVISLKTKKKNGEMVKCLYVEKLCVRASIPEMYFNVVHVVVLFFKICTCSLAWYFIHVLFTSISRHDILYYLKNFGLVGFECSCKQFEIWYYLSTPYPPTHREKSKIIKIRKH